MKRKELIEKILEYERMRYERSLLEHDSCFVIREEFKYLYGEHSEMDKPCLQDKVVWLMSYWSDFLADLTDEEVHWRYHDTAVSEE